MLGGIWAQLRRPRVRLDPSHQTLPVLNLTEIYLMATHPRAQGHGVGHRLIEWALRTGLMEDQRCW